MIGQTLYIYDYNRENRNLDREERFRSGFVPVVITGETSKSWTGIVYHWPVRFNKRDLAVGGYRSPGMHLRGYTAERMEEEVYIQMNRHLIVRAVQNCHDGALLKQIDALLNRGAS